MRNRRNSEVRTHEVFVRARLRFRYEPAEIEEDPIHSNIDHLLAKVVHYSDVFWPDCELNGEVWRFFDSLKPPDVLGDATVDASASQLVIL